MTHTRQNNTDQQDPNSKAQREPILADGKLANNLMEIPSGKMSFLNLGFTDPCVKEGIQNKTREALKATYQACGYTTCNDMMGDMVTIDPHESNDLQHFLHWNSSTGIPNNLIHVFNKITLPSMSFLLIQCMLNSVNPPHGIYCMAFDEVDRQRNPDTIGPDNIRQIIFLYLKDKVQPKDFLFEQRQFASFVGDSADPNDLNVSKNTFIALSSELYDALIKVEGVKISYVIPRKLKIKVFGISQYCDEELKFVECYESCESNINAFVRNKYPIERPHNLDESNQLFEDEMAQNSQSAISNYITNQYRVDSSRLFESRDKIFDEMMNKFFTMIFSYAQKLTVSDTRDAKDEIMKKCEFNFGINDLEVLNAISIFIDEYASSLIDGVFKGVIFKTGIYHLLMQNYAAERSANHRKLDLEYENIMKELLVLILSSANNFIAFADNTCKDRIKKLCCDNFGIEDNDILNDISEFVVKFISHLYYGVHYVQEANRPQDIDLSQLNQYTLQFLQKKLGPSYKYVEECENLKSNIETTKINVSKLQDEIDEIDFELEGLESDSQIYLSGLAAHNIKVEDIGDNNSTDLMYQFMLGRLEMLKNDFSHNKILSLYNRAKKGRDGFFKSIKDRMLQSKVNPFDTIYSIQDSDVLAWLKEHDKANITTLQYHEGLIQDYDAQFKLFLSTPDATQWYENQMQLSKDSASELKTSDSLVFGTEKMELEEISSERSVSQLTYDPSGSDTEEEIPSHSFGKMR